MCLSICYLTVVVVVLVIVVDGCRNPVGPSLDVFVLFHGSLNVVDYSHLLQKWKNHN